MSTQRRSCFALKCSSPDLVGLPAVPGISLSGSDSFTLGATVFVDRNASDQIVVEQPGVFSFGHDGGAVVFRAGQLGSFRSDPADFRLMENAWNRIDVSYDGSTVKLFIQGLLAFERDAVGERYVDNQTRWRMGDMDGYLQEVTLVSRALTDDEVRFDQFEHVLPDDQMELYADFDRFDPVDRGRHTLPLQVAGHCDVVNLVSALHAGRHGFAAPHGAGIVNPGAFETEAFTILAKVFPVISVDDRDAVVFANGAWGEAQTVLIGLSDRQTRPFVWVGGMRCEFEDAVPVSLWSDLAVTVSGTDVAFFIDGKPSGSAELPSAFARTEGPLVTLGNAEPTDAQRGFEGYVDSVAVFDKALPADRLAAYADIAPYRFDEDLKALWLFSDEVAGEVMAGGAVVYGEGAEVSLRENTVRDPVLPILQFSLPDVETSMSDMETWENRTAAEILLEAVRSFSNQDPVSGFAGEGTDKLNGSVAKLVATALTSLGSVQEIERSGKATSAAIVGIVDAMVIASELAPLVQAFYLSYVRWNHGNRIIRFVNYYRYYSVATRYKILPVFIAAAVGIAVYIAVTESPEPEEKEEDGAVFDLSTVGYYSKEDQSKGAICLRQTFSESPNLPEWKRVTAEGAAAYYRVEGDVVPSLTVTFEILSVERSVTVSIGAAELGDALLGSLDEVEVSIESVGPVSVRYPLRHHALSSAVLGEHIVRLQWFIGDDLWGSTTHEIHVLPGQPQPPWGLAPSDDNVVALPGLRFAEFVMSQGVGARPAGLDAELNADGTSADFASNLVDTLQQSGRFEPLGFDDRPCFSRWDEGHFTLNFDAPRFCQAFQGSAEENPDPAGMTALDCACALFVFMRQQGFSDVRLAEVGSFVDCGTFNIRSVRRMGRAEPDGWVSLDVHTVCLVGAPDAELVYDAYLAPLDDKGTMFAVKGLPFSVGERTTGFVDSVDAGSYRTIVCMPGSCCEITLAAEMLSLGSSPVEGIRPGDPVVERYTFRPDFDPSVARAIPVPPYLVRCHSTSFASIELIITSAINHYISTVHSSKMLANALLDLWRSLTLNRTNMGGTPDPQNELQKASLLLLLMADSLTSDPGREGWARWGEELSCIMNSMIENLRLGMSDWNGSLQESFDPVSWYHIARAGTAMVCDCAWDNPNVNQDISVIPGPPVMNPGFYLTDENDGVRLSHLRDRVPTVDVGGHVSVVQRAIVGTDNEIRDSKGNPIADRRRRCISSSNNTWRLEEAKYAKLVAHEPVFYWNDLVNPPAWRTM